MRSSPVIPGPWFQSSPKSHCHWEALQSLKFDSLELEQIANDKNKQNIFSLPTQTAVTNHTLQSSGDPLSLLEWRINLWVAPGNSNQLQNILLGCLDAQKGKGMETSIVLPMFWEVPKQQFTAFTIRSFVDLTTWRGSVKGEILISKRPLKYPIHTLKVFKNVYQEPDFHGELEINSSIANSPLSVAQIHTLILGWKWKNLLRNWTLGK